MLDDLLTRSLTFFSINSIQQIEYLDLRATGLEGEVPPEICAIDFELFQADCGSVNEKSSGKMICACCVWCHDA